MNDLGQQIHQYLRDLMGIEVNPVPWEPAAGLPAFLAGRYRFFHGMILSHPVIFLADQASDEETPASIRKHIAQIRPNCDWPVVYVRERVTAYNRKRLIEHRVPFLVPGNQLYLPELGIDLREHFRRQAEPRSGFRPATQAVFIHALLREGDAPLTVAGLAMLLGYSAMSIGRAFDDIAAADLAVSRTAGRERTLVLAAQRRELWTRAQPLLKTPVKGRRFVRARDGVDLGLKAGLSALAEYSMLAEPQNPVVAVSRERWRVLREQGEVVEIPMQEPDACEVETWTYVPRPYRDGTAVDPLSLALSLSPAADERVEQALEQMLETLPW
ncbi:MAG: hypothetical protein KJZ54_06930 [Phycisphaerales bacterium]|nr:hypothetical protein [Phycisphaerales bacterium]